MQNNRQRKRSMKPEIKQHSIRRLWLSFYRRVDVGSKKKKATKKQTLKKTSKAKIGTRKLQSTWDTKKKGHCRLPTKQKSIFWWLPASVNASQATEKFLKLHVWWRFTSQQMLMAGTMLPTSFNLCPVLRCELFLSVLTKMAQDTIMLKQVLRMDLRVRVAIKTSKTKHKKISDVSDRLNAGNQNAHVPSGGQNSLGQQLASAKYIHHWTPFGDLVVQEEIRLVIKKQAVLGQQNK